MNRNHGPGEDSEPKAGHRPALKRSLSLTQLTLYGLGTTVGAGIYVLVGKVAGQAGLFTPVAFLVAALLATLTAFSFAELSSRFPRSAGEAVYVMEGLGSKSLSLAVGLLVALAGLVSSAAITVGAVGYLLEFVTAPPLLLIALMVLLLGGLAAWGIAESVTVAAVLTLVEIGGLLLVIASGLEANPDMPARLDSLLPPLELPVWSGILAGALLAFYAFIGFEDMVNVAEEVKDASRTLPRAILLTMAVTALIYLLLTAVAVLAVAPAELAESDAPLALIYARTSGGSATVISLIAIFATVNGALIQIIMASRVLYGLSRQQVLPAALGQVSALTRTPLLATSLATALMMVLALLFPIETLARATSAVTLVIFCLVNLALLRVQHSQPAPADTTTVPRAIPLAGLVISAAFLVLECLRLATG